MSDRHQPALLTSLLVLLLALAGACQAPDDIEVQSEFAPGVISDLGKTFDWFPVPAREGRTPAAAEFDALVRSTIEEELRNRGYSKRAETPDFLVDFDLGARAARESPFVGAEVYEEGAIGIMLVAPDQQTGLWRGIAKGRVEPSTTPSERRKRIRRAIRSILAELPRVWR